MVNLSVEQMSAMMVRDLTEGFPLTAQPHRGERVTLSESGSQIPLPQDASEASRAGGQERDPSAAGEPRVLAASSARLRSIGRSSRPKGGHCGAAAAPNATRRGPLRPRHQSRSDRHPAGEGVDLTRVVACHQDGAPWSALSRWPTWESTSIRPASATSSTATNGAYDATGVVLLHRRAEGARMVRLVQAGYTDQLLLSHDICVKMQLRRYGLNGYAHVLENIAPMLRHFGVTSAQIRTMTVENPPVCSLSDRECGFSWRPCRHENQKKSL